VLIEKTTHIPIGYGATALNTEPGASVQSLG